MFTCTCIKIYKYLHVLNCFVALKNVMNLSDANIHCICPEAKSLGRQHLSSTHTLAIIGYIEPKVAVICQKFICLEMEMTNALLHWNKSCCFFTPICKLPQFAAFLAAELREGHPSARLCSVRVVPFLLKSSNYLFSRNWPVELVYWTWTSPHLKAFPTGYHQHYLPCLEGLLQKNPTKPIFSYQAHIIWDSMFSIKALILILLFPCLSLVCPYGII